MHEKDDPIALYYGISKEERSETTQPEPKSRRLRRFRHWRKILIPAGIVLAIIVVWLLGGNNRDLAKAAIAVLSSPVGVAGIAAAILAGAILILAKPDNVLGDLSTELISIAITVIALGILVDWQQTQQLKAQLIRDFGGQSNEFAIHAAQELKLHGWLFDDSLQNRNLSNANLQDVDLGGTELRRVNLQDVDLSEANLTNANLDSTNLKDSNLLGINLKNASLTHTDLSESVLIEANLQNASGWYVDLEGGDLTRANLKNAYLVETDLKKALLIGADLRNARLVAKFQGANLSYANLEGADISPSSLQGAYLLNTNLLGADLEKVRLEGAKYNNATIWPTGFDPEEAGAINVDEQDTEPE